MSFTVPIHREVEAAFNRSSHHCRGKRPDPIFHRLHYTGEHRTGVKTFQIQIMGNIPCNGSTLFPGRQMEGGNQFRVPGCGRGKRFPKCQGFLYCGPLPFHAELIMTAFPREGATSRSPCAIGRIRPHSCFRRRCSDPQISDLVRMTYPIILGTSLNFTLPPTAEGPSVEAELNGENIIFPLGPDPCFELGRLQCQRAKGNNGQKFYRCELNAGYQFQIEMSRRLARPRG